MLNTKQLLLCQSKVSQEQKSVTRPATCQAYNSFKSDSSRFNSLIGAGPSANTTFLDLSSITVRVGMPAGEITSVRINSAMRILDIFSGLICVVP